MATNYFRTKALTGLWAGVQLAHNLRINEIMLRTGASKTPADTLTVRPMVSTSRNDRFDDIPGDEDEDIVVPNNLQSYGSREGVG